MFEFCVAAMMALTLLLSAVPGSGLGMRLDDDMHEDFDRDDIEDDQVSNKLCVPASFSVASGRPS